MKRRPPLNAIRVFEVSARLGNFSRAAEELAITQGAVSRQIKALEVHLGLELFRRIGRSVALTQEGRDYHSTVRKALEAIDRKSEQLSRRRAREKLTLSTVPSFAAKWIAPRLASWRAVSSNIELRIISSYEHSNFRRDGIDVAVRYGRGPWPGLHSEKLAIEELFPVCSAKYARVQRLHEARDLLLATLLERELTEGWSEWFSAVGISAPRLESSIRMRDATAVIEAAIEGQGVALGNYSLVALDLAAGRLIRPVKGALVSSFAYHFVCLPSSLDREPVARFRKWLADEMQRT